jgi:hypothetical protein
VISFYVHIFKAYVCIYNNQQTRDHSRSKDGFSDFALGGGAQNSGGGAYSPYFFYFELSETRLSAFSAFEVSFASRFTVLLLIQQNEANHYISC